MSQSSQRSWWPPRGQVADGAVAVTVGIIVVVATLISPSSDEFILPQWLSWLLLLIACGSLWWRRRYPIAVAICTLVMVAIYYPFTGEASPVFITHMLALYSVAEAGRLTAAVVISAITMVGVVIGETAGPVRHIDDIAMFMLVGWFVAIIAVGAVVRSRSQLLEQERSRADEEARLRSAEERLRIAREVHDVVGHNISLISVQAAAALHRLQRDPRQAESALATIKDTSRQTLRELRSTLNVLRRFDEDVPMNSASRMSQLDELLAGARAAGLAIEADATGSPAALSAETDLACYRIIQESLTNVVKHAAASEVAVRVEYGDRWVDITVDDNGVGFAADAPAGHGLAGMSERAARAGGEFEVSARPGGGSRVHARLPIDTSTLEGS